MKNTKKIIALILTAIMTLALSVSVFAADDGFGGIRYSDEASVVITKVYRLEGAGKSPAETFTLEQVGDGIVKDGEAESAPALGTVTGASFEEGAATANGTEAQITVALPEYDHVGVYEYTLREVAGTTAGVTYYGNDIRLTVTVINDDETGRLRIAAVHTESVGEEKNDTFTNTYSAGTLQIKKTVTGILGDKTRYFRFTVTLNGEEGKTYNDTYAVGETSYAENPTEIKIGETATFYLKHDETLAIENLPYGVSYTVEEDTPDDYTVTMTASEGVIGAASVTASFTNNKGGTPDTGISLDSLPYVAILVLAVAGSAFMIARKYTRRDR